MSAVLASRRFKAGYQDFVPGDRPAEAVYMGHIQSGYYASKYWEGWDKAEREHQILLEDQAENSDEST